MWGVCCCKVADLTKVAEEYAQQVSALIVQIEGEQKKVSELVFQIHDEMTKSLDLSDRLCVKEMEIDNLKLIVEEIDDLKLGVDDDHLYTVCVCC